MTTLLQISDPHFGTVRPAVAEGLVWLAAQQRPDALVLSGDITQRAKSSQFSEARAFCDRLAIPLMLAIPGNHDISLFNPYQRLVTPYARFLKAFGPTLEPSISTPALHIIGVKTTRRWRHTNGEVSDAQIARVAAQLQQSTSEQLRVVVVHQPVHIPRKSDKHDHLRGGHRAVRAWADAGADIVMGGHIHWPYCTDMSSQMAGLARRLWCVQAGTALSSRVRDGIPNSVNLLRYDGMATPGTCLLERWDFQKYGGQFECVESTALALAR